MADEPQTSQDAALGFSVAGFILGATMLQAAVRRGAITAEDARKIISQGARTRNPGFAHSACRRGHLIDTTPETLEVRRSAPRRPGLLPTSPPRTPVLPPKTRDQMERIVCRGRCLLRAGVVAGRSSGPSASSRARDIRRARRHGTAGTGAAPFTNTGKGRARRALPWGRRRRRTCRMGV